MASLFENRGYPCSVTNPGDQQRKSTRQFQIRGQSLMCQQSTSSPHLPLKEPGSQENSSQELLTDDPTTKEIFNTKPLCIYRHDTRLQDILVHSTLTSRADDTLATPVGTFPCHRPRCPTCDFTGRTAMVTNANRDVWLKGWFDCTVAGVVYVIMYQCWHKLYIGETSLRLSDCFGEHLCSVEGFKQNPCYQEGGFPVAEHFNLPDYNQVHDMRVSVVRQVKGGAPT